MRWVVALLDRLRFQLSSVVAYAKAQAPERPEETDGGSLAEMERELAEGVKNDLADRLDLDPEVFDDVQPPSEQRGG